jgi:hypothetical protein
MVQFSEGYSKYTDGPSPDRRILYSVLESMKTFWKSTETVPPAGSGMMLKKRRKSLGISVRRRHQMYMLLIVFRIIGNTPTDPQQ